MLTSTRYDERGEYLAVPCAVGEFYIDPEDLPTLGDFNWYITKSRGYEKCQYVVRNRQGRGGMILLHRVIMNAPEGMTVDHRDWNGTNDRKYNLRICTFQQNTRRVRPGSPRSGKTSASGVRGVYPTKSGKWVSVITIDWRQQHLGTFDSVESAGRAWDAAALAARGEFAVLNYPSEARP